MTYLFLGEDGGQKETKIAELKKRFLGPKDVLSFDYEVLYGHKLAPDTLKKALLALPVISPQRIVIIHDCHKLTPQNKKIVLEFVSSAHEHLVLILESNSLRAKDSFVKDLKPYVKMANSSGPQELNVFDMTRAISMQRRTEALKILSELLSQGAPPLKIMGGLVWFWGELQKTLAYEKFQKGLRALQMADLNIKRSRMKPEHALEVLVVKLSVILE